jgi:hypothetical protein
MRRHRRHLPARVHLDAARWLPSTEPRDDGFVRFGAPGGPIPRDGIFVLAYRALEERSLEPWEASAIREAVSWFEEHLPVHRPRTPRAVCFLRAGERALARRLWDLAHLLRAAGIFVEMVGRRRVSRVVSGDRVQIAAIHPER